LSVFGFLHHRWIRKKDGLGATGGLVVKNVTVQQLPQDEAALFRFLNAKAGEESPAFAVSRPK
jgi:hypothetical protein